MLAFPDMLVPAAKQAGIAVPPDCADFDPEQYPYFRVFCLVQLGRSMPTPQAHWENAKVIADIPEDRIRLVTFTDLVAAGLQ